MEENAKRVLERIFRAGISAVMPDGALKRHVRCGRDAIWVDGVRHGLEGRRIFVVGAGKGVAPMAAALEDLLGDRIKEGLVVAKYGHGAPLSRIRLCEGGHPVTDENGVRAAEELLRLAGSAQEGDLLIALFTGGASALTCVPAEGVSLADIQDVTSSLLRNGADIAELNAVRKHLSAFSGGQLARVAHPAEVVTLLVSDVMGDAMDVIASGPTVPDLSTFNDCRAVLERRCADIPSSVQKRVSLGCEGLLQETPKPGDPCFASSQAVLIATLDDALDAAAAEAARLGLDVIRMPDLMKGEARNMAEAIVENARIRHAVMKAAGRENAACVIYGGETTVTVKGRGKGGRNQEMALAASLACAGAEGMSFLFAGTDGTDGPTDAAGGFAGGQALFRLAADADGSYALGRAFLQENDSYPALEKMGMLFKTGPTRTNVMDMALVLLEP